MHRVHPGVAVEDREQDGGVADPFAHVVVGRVGEQPAELLRVGGGAELVVPGLAEPEPLVPDHVQQRSGARGRGV
jgi:hypothetical protein